MFKPALLFLLLLLVVPKALFGQWGNPGFPNDQTPQQRHIGPHGPRPAFDVLQFKSPTYSDSTRVDLYLAVPYRSLEFLYAIDKYVADYSVSVQVSLGNTTVLDRYASYSVLEPVSEHHASGFSGTHARADAEQLSFQLSHAEHYTMHLTVHDFYSREEFDTSFEFGVRDFTSSTPSMSNLLLYRDRQGMNVIPSIGPDVSSLESETGEPSTSGLFAELYNMPSGENVGVVTEIFPQTQQTSDMQGALPRSTMLLDITSSNRQFLTGEPTPDQKSSGISPQNVTPLFQAMTFDNLWGGLYTIHTYILPSASDTGLRDTSELAGRAIAMVTRTIIVTTSHGIPISVTDLDQAIEQLRLIASGSEWDSLSAAHTPLAKRTAILNFWAGKRFAPRNAPFGTRQSNSNPAMEIFYSRVEYANAHFATSFQPGWKSDRGRIYIALGPPDQIENHPEGYTQSYGGMQMPYEIWGYNSLRMHYTFVDEYMLGDYRLRGAPPPEGTFIWQ